MKTSLLYNGYKYITMASCVFVHSLPWAQCKKMYIQKVNGMSANALKGRPMTKGWDNPN